MLRSRKKILCSFHKIEFSVGYFLCNAFDFSMSTKAGFTFCLVYRFTWFLLIGVDKMLKMDLDVDTIPYVVKLSAKILFFLRYSGTWQWMG